MKPIRCLLLAAITLLGFVQCDDNTGTLGGSTIPEKDKIIARTDTLFATSKTIMVNDSILANSSDTYLGQYTDKESGVIFNSSFITQFGCTENFEFPEEGVIGDTATYTTLRLFFEQFYGDSLNSMTCEIYELDNSLVEGTPYYTNLSPEEFYDEGKAPLARKTFNAVDYSKHDTLLNSENYSRHIEITLPNSIGNKFISKFYEKDAEGNNIGKSYFANAEVFINEMFKGIYVKCTHGDGTVLKIYRARLDVGFRRYIKSSSGEIDSIQPLSAPFYSGKEVLQSNKFSTKGLDKLAAEQEHTYIKTPAGLFTEVTLPVMDVIEIMEKGDTINSAKISFTRYNQEESLSSTPHSTLLMVRKPEMHRFFLKYELANSQSSFLTSFTSSNNEYTFSDISNIFRLCYKEYTEGIETDPDWESNNPDWNKVVLIPVTTTEDANGSIVKITHDIGIGSVKLRGGTSYQIPMQVITSKFNDK